MRGEIWCTGNYFFVRATRIRYNEDMDKEITYYRLDVIDSTSTHAARILSEQEDVFCVSAKVQKEGRGRAHRAFFSPIGGLYFTLGIPESFDHPVAIYAGVGIRKAILQTFGVSVAFKWVNDLIYRDGKVGGILCEKKTDRSGKLWTLIGAGINVFSDVENSEFSRVARSLKIENADLDLFLIACVREILDALEKPWEDVLAEYRNHMMLIGKTIEFECENKMRLGRVLSVESDGALLVECDGGSLRLSCGEVSLNSERILKPSNADF